MDYCVFISHTGADKNIARELGLFLASENINVWFDEWEISVGESITAKISDGLAKCTHFIIVWSRNAQKSKWVENEMNSATYLSVENNVKILPVVIDDAKLPPLVNDKLHLVYDGGTEKDRATLIEAITGNSPSNNYIKAIVKKYNEVIFDDESDDILPFNACPKCGTSRLNRLCYNSNNEHTYFIISCKECDWMEVTE